jgi:hypothetical protein
MSSVSSHTQCVPLSCVRRPPGRLGQRVALFMSAVGMLGGYGTAVISAPLQFIKRRWEASLAVGVTFPLRVHAIGAPATPWLNAGLCMLAPSFALDVVPEGPTPEQIAAYRRPVTAPRVSPEPGPSPAGW